MTGRGWICTKGEKVMHLSEHDGWRVEQVVGHFGPPAPMDEFVRLAQAYKVAPFGRESEAALLALCSYVEKLVMMDDTDQ
jgi:hypothetical protein